MTPTSTDGHPKGTSPCPARPPLPPLPPVPPRSPSPQVPGPSIRHTTIGFVARHMMVQGPRLVRRLLGRGHDRREPARFVGVRRRPDWPRSTPATATVTVTCAPTTSSTSRVPDDDARVDGLRADGRRLHVARRPHHQGRHQAGRLRSRVRRLRSPTRGAAPAPASPPTATINRKDWGIEWNAPLETGGVIVGDKVQIELDIQLVKS